MGSLNSSGFTTVSFTESIRNSVVLRLFFDGSCQVFHCVVDSVGWFWRWFEGRLVIGFLWRSSLTTIQNSAQIHHSLWVFDQRLALLCWGHPLCFKCEHWLFLLDNLISHTLFEAWAVGISFYKEIYIMQTFNGLLENFQALLWWFFQMSKLTFMRNCNIFTVTHYDQ